MKHRAIAVIAASLAIAVATSASAATVVFSSKQPAPGPDDIANLKGASKEAKNVNEGNNDATYIADDRPVQGQTFTTGSKTGGYVLRAITLREVPFDTYALVPDLTYTIRIIQPVEGKLTVLSTETATVAADAPGNFPSIGDGNDVGTGSGDFVTFVLEKPVTLKPDTTYGFDVSGGADRHYWQWDGTDKDVYTGGVAYSILPKESMTERTGDHVFVVAMSQPSATEAAKTSAKVTEASEATHVANSDTAPVAK